MEIDVRHWLCTTSVAAIVAWGPAFASDLPTHKAPPPPPPPAVFSWTGCYVGFHAGGDFGRSNWTMPNGGAAGVNTNGAIGGGQVGCNYQANAFVIGGEAEVWASGLKGSTALQDPIFIRNVNTYETRSDFAGDLALRGGFAIDRLLMFGKVGLALARYEYSYTNQNTGAYAGEATHTGLLLGLGAEFAFDSHWSVKAEYDHIDYGHDSIGMSGGATFNASLANVENIVKAGANYRF
jgi:outer membrane immunogenic protein